MLACCTNIHGEQVVHRVVLLFFHGGLLAKYDRAGFNVAVNLEMLSQAAECESDLVLWLSRNGSWQEALHT